MSLYPITPVDLNLGKARSMATSLSRLGINPQEGGLFSQPAPMEMPTAPAGTPTALAQQRFGTTRPGGFDYNRLMERFPQPDPGVNMYSPTPRTMGPAPSGGGLGGVGDMLKYGGLVKNPYWDGSPNPVGRPGDMASLFYKTSQYLSPEMLWDFNQTNEAGG